MLLSLALAAAAAAPQPGVLQLYQDWTVGCDNGLACQAVALMPEGRLDGAATMVLRRGPEPEAPVSARIVSPDGAPVLAEADGRRFRLVQAPDGAAVAPADIPDLIAVLRRAPALRLTDAGGTALGAVSLAGASAALLFIDAQQRRVGTQTALVRPGPRPASAVPRPPALPVVRAAAASDARPARLDRAALVRRHVDQSCGSSFGPEDVEIARLDAATTLALVPDRCNSGAYNIGHVVLVADNRGRTRRAEFDVSPGWGEDDRLAVNASWDPVERRFSSFAKARGLGDCGAIHHYAWDGRRFRLVERLMMGECRGSGDYVPLWRAEVRVGA